MSAHFLSLVSLLFLHACTVGGWNQTISSETRSFPAEGVTRARLETSAGKLTVLGEPGRSVIEVNAEYKASTGAAAERVLERLKLTTEVRGDTFHLKTDVGTGWSWSNQGSIDVTITLPAAIALDVEDGAGSMLISGMESEVVIEDGSGSIRAQGIRGDLRIDDGSGSIEVLDILRNVEIEDGSGGIVVRHVGGDVTIEDGSGSIRVTDVGGNLRVPREGSGSLSYADVRGSIDVPRRR